MATIKVPGELPGIESQTMPRVAGKFSGPLLICGSGRCLWDDLERLGEWPGDMMCVNLCGIFIPRKPQHWVSLHADFFQWMLPLRQQLGDVTFSAEGVHVGHVIHTHSIQHCAGVMHVWPKLFVPPGEGGSGMGAIRIGFGLGYESCVLAGMPMDGSGYFYDPPQPTHNHTGFFDAVRNAHISGELRGRVKSLSGRTRELLGAP